MPVLVFVVVVVDVLVVVDSCLVVSGCFLVLLNGVVEEERVEDVDVDREGDCS